MPSSQPTTHTIDATGMSLGRLASEIAVKLRGKDDPTWQPYMDSGARVIVQHVDQLKLTGNKINQKVFYHHSGYPGGIKTRSMKDLMQNDPARLLRQTVRLMLPDNKLRAPMLNRLIIE